MWVHIPILLSISKLHMTVEFGIHSFCCELDATWPILGRDTTTYIQMVTRWRSEMYRLLLPMCHVYIKVRIKFASCLFSYTSLNRMWDEWCSRYSDWLWAGWSGDQIPVGLRFSVPVQASPGAHPASYTMGNGVFPGGKEWPGHDADPSPPSSAVVKKE